MLVRLASVSVKSGIRLAVFCLAVAASECCFQSAIAEQKALQPAQKLTSSVALQVPPVVAVINSNNEKARKQFQPNCQRPADDREGDFCNGARQANAAEAQVSIYRNQLYWMRLGTIVTALAAFAAVAAAWAAERSIRANRRPKLMVREFLHFPLTVGPKLRISFVVSNAGNAPGTIVESHVECTYGSHNEWHPPKKESKDSNPIGEKTIAAGAQITVETNLELGSHTLMAAAITQETAEREDRFGPSLQTSPIPKTIHVNGFVVYRDIQGIRRRTGFWRSLNPRSLRFDRHDDPDYEYAD
jgi:hypothetical protein